MTLDDVVVALICILCIVQRLWPVWQFGWIIHEYDPWFNFRMTKYLYENGVRAFWTWHDEMVWYPNGRDIIRTTYPGLMLLTAGMKFVVDKAVRMEIPLEAFCAFIPCIFSSITVWMTYRTLRTCFKCNVGAFIGAFCMAIIPAFYSRSMAGSFDYECVSITLLLLIFYNYLNWSVANNNAAMFKCILWQLLLAFTWGGYVFSMILLAMHLGYLTVFCGDWKRTDKVAMYLFFCCSISFGAAAVPCIRSRIFTSIDHLPINILIGVLTCLLLLRCKVGHKILMALVASATGLLMFSRSELEVGERVKLLLGGQTASDPIALSIGEHQPTTWMVFFTDFHFTLLSTGLFVADRLKLPWDISNKESFLMAYLWFSLYLAAKMVRLELLLAPICCMCTGIWIERNWHKFGKITVITIGIIFALHCIWTNITLHSNPIIVIPTKTGGYMDDFREAYRWLRQNTPAKSTIAAWWDYGYQINGMAERTTFVDNHTSNFKQIATIALFLLSPEKAAHKTAQVLGIDYVMIVNGSTVNYLADDLNKFGWLVKIAAFHFPHLMNVDDYVGQNGKITFDSKTASPNVIDSLLYKLSFYNLHKINPSFICPVRMERFLPIHRLQYFESVFNSSHVIVRIYKVVK